MRSCPFSGVQLVIVECAVFCVIECGGVIVGRTLQQGTRIVGVLFGIAVAKRIVSLLHLGEKEILTQPGVLKKDGVECFVCGESRPLGNDRFHSGGRVAQGQNDPGFTIPVETAVGVAAIRVSQEEITIPSGESYTINATVEMEEEYQDSPATIQWSSNNTSVATVSEDGVITARQVGNAIIKGVAGTQTVEISVEVVENTSTDNSTHDATQDVGQEPEDGTQTDTGDTGTGTGTGDSTGTGDTGTGSGTGGSTDTGTGTDGTGGTGGTTSTTG